ncbi:MAG: hypothetical protein J6C75_06125 [Oscillospiraceae bacterium]|nr:hypothetical protein [Oscillospiraceae bacterium]
MFQQILAVTLLAVGMIYGAAVLLISYRNKSAVGAEKGNMAVLAVAEALVYLCASFGISDYLLNTLVLKHTGCADDRLIPGTLVAGCVTPGAIIAFSLLRADSNPIDAVLLMACSAGVITGSIIGSKLVGRFDGARIKKIMRIALVCSFIVLLVRMMISIEGGSENSLNGIKLAIAAAACVITAAINMFGIPMKPTWTALFLMLGLSSLTTLTLVLLLGALGPVAGGSRTLYAGSYHRKTVLCATITGSLGAFMGTMFAISIPAVVLNILLMAVMLIAIITMFKKS